jgi:hypothetical protein
LTIVSNVSSEESVLIIKLCATKTLGTQKFGELAFTSAQIEGHLAKGGLAESWVEIPWADEVQLQVNVIVKKSNFFQAVDYFNGCRSQQN